ncbi:MAG: prolyl oligopeptidase family serine peptidase [Armatimonadota bacterium]|nr:prolyl oligopeptidase family serine peptidase [bacterium]
MLDTQAILSSGRIKTDITDESVTPVAGRQCEIAYSASITIDIPTKYMLYLPKDYGADVNKRWPLVFFLHGMGSWGADVTKLKKYGPVKLVEDGREFPFILVSPLCPVFFHWCYQIEWLKELLDKIEADYSVDNNRIYLTGLSMGGYASWALAARQPDRFAAIVPICGGGNPNDAPLMKDIPMWVFHGDKDRVVPLSESQKMVDAVKAAGGNPKFTIYPGVDHDSWTDTYNNGEVWDWLLEQRRTARV